MTREQVREKYSKVHRNKLKKPLKVLWNTQKMQEDTMETNLKS